jgi:ABC-type transport system involved in multi-copper enzyme maturation permease subunit
MTFLALLTKEMRLSMRRERTIWVIVAYIFLLGLFGWLVINSSTHGTSNNINTWSSIGYLLYTLLLLIQVFLILFITPAFTSTSVNGEKERQTFDLLLCSQLSTFSLIAGKLLAGLVNALLLIAASLPLFSLVFFFGGVSPLQAVQGLVVSVSTALVAATLGILCSAIFQRPAVSTAITYMLVLLWLVSPLILATMAPPQQPIQISPVSPIQEPPPQLFLMWNPVVALMTTFSSPYYFGFPRGNYLLGTLNFAAWQGYIVLNLITTGIFFLCSLWFVKPHPILWQRLGTIRNNVWKQKTEEASVTT